MNEKGAVLLKGENGAVISAKGAHGVWPQRAAADLSGRNRSRGLLSPSTATGTAAGASAPAKGAAAAKAAAPPSAAEGAAGTLGAEAAGGASATAEGAAAAKTARSGSGAWTSKGLAVGPGPGRPWRPGTEDEEGTVYVVGTIVAVVVAAAVRAL